MGLPNQTGNLLSVGSSSGQRYSTNLDIATRLNFAAASSTGNLTIGTSTSPNTALLTGIPKNRHITVKPKPQKYL